MQLPCVGFVFKGVFVMFFGTLEDIVGRVWEGEKRECGRGDMSGIMCTYIMGTDLIMAGQAESDKEGEVG